MAEQLKQHNSELTVQTHSSTDILPKLTDELAHKNQSLLKAVMPMMNLNDASSQAIFVKALDRFKITEKELNEGFWQAYADPYVPQSGLEFRHLWKHIEVMRKGEGRRSYTYEQMLVKMDQDKISMEAFSMIDELDHYGFKKWVIK